MSPRRILPALLAASLSGAYTRAAEVDYLRDVKPILARSCFACHAGKVQMADLRLDTGAAILRGGKSGPAVIPGRSAESKLIRALRGESGLMPMPFGKEPLGAEEIARLASWID